MRVGMCFRDDVGVKRYLLLIEMQRERGKEGRALLKPRDLDAHC